MKHKIYIKTDDQGYITDIGSDVFIEDPENWIEIDEGEGDRYVHAQGNYLPGPIRDDDGNPTYIWTGGSIVPAKYAGIMWDENPPEDTGYYADYPDVDTQTDEE